jgi:3-deoxy-D-manno-octulosonic-acid transferase
VTPSAVPRFAFPRRLYTLAFRLALPLILLRLLWRGRRQPGYREGVGERFGSYGRRPPRGDVAPLWLHAVSVGEMRAAEPLLRALRAAHPELPLLLTCMTPTGRETARSLYGDLATIVWLPYDLPGACERFLHHFAPRAGVLMETEIWPNLIAACARRRVPLLLVNARLSERSAAAYRRVAALVRPALAALTAVGAQSAADADRLASLGAPAPAVCGNLKFDVTPRPELLALGEAWRQRIGARPVWLAASTREGEEATVLAAFGILRRRLPGALLILVPRHPQRFDEAAALASAAGFSLARRSLALPSADVAVWLGDSMGEMAAYYAAAELALIGGSLKPFGAQNLIEACACGCPVLIGPSDFNFRQATADALAAGAARRVDADPQEIATAAAALLADRPSLAAMRAAAGRFAGAHRGATARTLALIEPLLGAP